MRFRIEQLTAKIRRQCISLAQFQLLLLSFLLCFFTPATAQQPHNTLSKPLVFGVYAHIRSTEMIQKMVPLQQYLMRAMVQKGVSVDFQIRIYSSYAEAIDALLEGKVDFVRYGPVSYVIANQYSTEGRFLPQIILSKAGIHCLDFKQVAHLGDHDRVIFSVAAGNYDVGVTRKDVFYRYADEKELSRIKQFPAPEKVRVAGESLEPRLGAALSEALLQLKGVSALEPLGLVGFDVGLDQQYEKFRVNMQHSKGFDRG